MNTYQSEFSSFSKVSRLLWLSVQASFFRIGLRNTHAWRRVLLRFFGSHIHSSCKIYPSIRVWSPKNLELHEGTILGDRVDCYNVAPIILGAGVIISQDACLCAATHDYESPAFTLQPKPIVIGKGAWVCARAFIGPGVSVGRFAVVGACAVVTKDVPPFSVVAGNPAKFIKWRDMSKFPSEKEDAKKFIREYKQN